MWLLIMPLMILFVLVFALVAVAAGIFALLGAAWPWLLIGLGLWLFWHEDGRHNRARHRRWAADRSGANPTGTIPTPRPAEQRPARQPRPRELRQAELPIDIQVKVEQIRRKVDVLLGYADRFPPFSQDLYLVRQTASEYLPRTISAYLALPKQAADAPLSADGKTAHQELKAQLDLLYWLIGASSKTGSGCATRASRCSRQHRAPELPEASSPQPP
jgi:hypothetical protein